jgi:hypothetical protein
VRVALSASSLLSRADGAGEQTSASIHNRLSGVGAHADDRWLFRMGGVLVLTDTVVTLLAGETDPEPGSLGASGWFAVLRERPLLGLRNLGLINVANLLVSLPLFAALYAAHRRTSGKLAGSRYYSSLLQR